MVERILYRVQEYPTLDINPDLSNSDYLDFVQENQVHAPVVHGTACGRKFIVVKFLVKTRGVKRCLIQTFHQRYSDNEKLWVGCGHATRNIFLTIGGMTAEQFLSLERILDGETVKLCLPGDDIDSYVRLAGKRYGWSRSC
jgi:hypothetical protein